MHRSPGAVSLPPDPRPASTPASLPPPPAEAAPHWGLVAAALLALYVVWGSTYFVIGVALREGLPPFLMAGVRFVLAGSLLYGVLRARGAPRPTGEQWLRAGAVGVLLLAMGNGCVVFAQQWVASSLAAVMVASMPLFAALFSGLWGQWPRAREWVGLVLGTAGVVLLNLEGDLRAHPLGAALLVLAPASWAFGSVWSRGPRMPKGLVASAMQMLVGGAVMSAVGLLRGEAFPAAPSLLGLGAVAYLIVFGSLLAFSAYGFLLRHVRPTLATSYAYVNPVVALLIGTGLGGERVGLAGLVGAGVILAGVALVVLGRARG